jgi:hypothetical protein
MPEADLNPVVSARLPIRDRCCWKIPTEQTDGMGTASAGKKKSHLKACGPGFHALLSRPYGFFNDTKYMLELK